MTLLHQREAARPDSLAQALALLGAAGEAAAAWRPLAGGTDLLVEAQHGRLAAGRLLDLSALHGELGGLRWGADGALEIGALCTYAALQRDDRAQRELPALCAMARLVGATQIQARGTLAGNVENASPAADVAPVLLALGASVVLRSAAGARELALDDYWTGYRQTARRADELIVALRVPPQPDGPAAQWARKVGTRAWQAITKVGLAARLGWEGGRLRRARVVAISMAPTICRVPAVERALLDADPEDPGTPARVERLAAAALAPIDDVRSTAAYRRVVFGRLVAQAYRETRARASGGASAGR
jgi:CO/xanthine dehydrogenase FAD-binding subunit